MLTTSLSYGMLNQRPIANYAEESVKELQRKRHSAMPGVSFAGRVRKAAKREVESEEESEWESESNYVTSSVIISFSIINS